MSPYNSHLDQLLRALQFIDFSQRLLLRLSGLAFINFQRGQYARMAYLTFVNSTFNMQIGFIAIFCHKRCISVVLNCIYAASCYVLTGVKLYCSWLVSHQAPVTLKKGGGWCCFCHTGLVEIMCRTFVKLQQPRGLSYLVWHSRFQPAVSIRAL